MKDTVANDLGFFVFVFVFLFCFVLCCFLLGFFVFFDVSSLEK